MHLGPPTMPRVSAIIPARNEEANIATCVRSLLAQGPAPGNDLEIIVADDGSEDKTAEIVRELAANSPSVRLISVPPLPAGWLGKNHALHAAVEQAQGEWLLFTDADTRHEPRTLAAVIARAEKENLDLVSFSPRQETRTWWEKAVIPLVFQELARLYPFSRVNDPHDPIAAANGQYILIRRKAYQAVGGHQAVRNEVVEDVELARLAKRAGFRIWFGSGEGVVSTRMYRRYSEMWDGWLKNLYPLYHRDRRAIHRTLAELGCRYLLPAAAGSLLTMAGGVWAAGAGVELLGYLAWEHTRYWRKLPVEDRIASTALLVPGALLFLLLLWHSELQYRRYGPFRWKGRYYRAAAQESSESGPLLETWKP
ncbi:MAG: glycosyltransferase [Terriglobia bacterium]